MCKMDCMAVAAAALRHLGGLARVSDVHVGNAPTHSSNSVLASVSVGDGMQAQEAEGSEDHLVEAQRCIRVRSSVGLLARVERGGLPVAAPHLV